MNEGPSADAPPPEEPLADETPARRGCSLGCLTRMLLTIAAAVVLVVIIGETFDQGAPDTPRNPDLNAGPAEEYARSDVAEWLAYKLYVVRLEDGSFLALHTRSSKQQEQDRSDCSVRWDPSAQLTGLEQLPGFTGAFVEDCGDLRATWRADGAFAGGAGYGDLDRYETSIDDAGNLIVDLDRRTCTRSRGVAGQPPFDVRTCGRGD